MTTKRGLYVGLALLTIIVLLGAGFLLIPRPITKWSYQPGLEFSSSFSPIVANGIIYTLFSDPGSENTLDAFDTHSGQTRWSYEIDGFISSPPIVANGIVYAVSEDSQIDEHDTLYALDAISGQEKWSYQQQALLYSPTIANGRVYISSTDGNLSDLDALSGHQIWTAQVGGYSATQPIVANSMVYITASHRTTQGSTVFALDAASGRKKWSVLAATSFIDHFIDQFTVANGLVYIHNTNAQVSALDAFSGSIKWSHITENLSTTNLLSFSSSFQVVNGMAYLDDEEVDTDGPISGANVLHALDAQTGQQVWAAQTVYPDPTIANGEVYVYTNDGSLAALNALSGRKQWSHKAVPFDDLFMPAGPEPTVVNSTVYVRTNAINNDTLYALDAVSGSEQWSYQTKGYFTTPPTVVNGIVYISINENLEAIQPPGRAPGFSL